MNFGWSLLHIQIPKEDFPLYAENVVNTGLDSCNLGRACVLELDMLIDKDLPICN